MLGPTLSHYRIKRKLGAGAMGEVYQAEDTRLQREVALKVLPPELAADSERLARFRREAQLLAALDHHGIVTIFSVEEAHNVHFLTMQLVEGKTLDQLIPPTGLPLDQFMDIAVQLTEAIAAAHEKGVIHRDVKPSNIMLTHEGRVKVLDFGLSKLAEPLKDSSNTERATGFLSEEGLVVGTLPYMSPEQVSGKSIDHRTDIFSLGIVFYEMVTGKRPFLGDTPAALVLAICTAKPAEISELRSGLPSILLNITARCLEKDPVRRIHTAKELHAELYKLHRGIESARGNVSDRLSASIAILPFASLSSEAEDEYFADGISEEIINALGRLPDLKVVGRTSSFSFKGKNEDLRMIGEKLGVDTVLEGSVRRAGKRLRITAQLVDVRTGYHRWSERYDREWTDVFDIQDEIARNIASRLTATLSDFANTRLVHQETDNLDAFQIYTQGRGLLEQRTSDEMRRAVSCFQQAVNHDSNYALAWAGLADALLLMQDYGYAVAENLLPNARQAIDRSLQLNPDLAEAHASLGLLHCFQHNGPAAIQALERAVQERPSYANTHNWLGWVHLILGNAKAALESARRAVDLNPLSPEALTNLSLAHLANDQYQQALREARRAREIQPNFETSSFYEGVTLYHMKRFEEAKKMLQKLSVPWAGAGPLGVVALAEVGNGQTSRLEEFIRQLQRANEYVCVGILHAALGEKDLALKAFETEGDWKYWPTLSILNFFKDALGPLRDEPRYQEVVRKAQTAWGVH